MGSTYLYIDILFVDNLVMNFIILRIVYKLSRNRSGVWRLWLAAAIGALYAVLIVLPELRILQKIPMKLALSLITLLTAFEINTFKEFIKIFIILYATTFIFGGAALSLYFINHEFVDISNGTFIISNYPIKNLAVACILVIMLVHSVLEYIRLRISRMNCCIRWRYCSKKKNLL